MFFNKLIKNSALFMLTVFPLLATASPTPATNPPLTSNLPDLHGQKLYDTYPWMLTFYHGVTTDSQLVPIFSGQFDRWPETIQSMELAKTLDPDNGFRRFFSPLIGVVQLAGNVAVRHGRNESTIYEFDPYIAFRWANFPWNNYVTTSVAIGEGVSYVTSYPSIEKRENYDLKRFLNYLMFEATFALPQHPQIQVIARIHHRSGAFGLYHAGNSGSNNVGLGIRYLFD